MWGIANNTGVNNENYNGNNNNNRMTTVIDANINNENDEGFRSYFP